jgi:hypothetical protein
MNVNDANTTMPAIELATSPRWRFSSKAKNSASENDRASAGRRDPQWLSLYASAIGKYSAIPTAGSQLTREMLPLAEDADFQYATLDGNEKI